MRFNPPPGWPAPPADWRPGDPHWTPDPSWPAPPPGWQLWVEAPPPPAESAPDTRGPLLTFFAGLGLVAAGAASLVISAGPKGGVLLYGLIIFGVVLVFRAVVAYRAARAEGAPPLAPPWFAASAVALVACLGFTGYAGFRQIATIGLSDTAGSCWQLDGPDLYLVACSGPHDFEALSETDDPATCPVRAEGWVETDRGTALCLARS